MKLSSFLPIRRLAILGPGLLGGSIGLAAHERKLAKEIVVWGRRKQSALEAVKCKAAHRVAQTPLEAVYQADLVILCTPVNVMPQLVKEFQSNLPTHSILTDVGSAKYQVSKKITQILNKRSTYIGSHPMAGAEKDGISAARADLFDGTVCILTPETQSHLSEVKKLSAFWEAIGCRTRILTPATHDQIVSSISHLPHLTAAALMNLVGKRRKKAVDFIGNGFRDMTRIASGPPEMWAQIALNNRNEIQLCIDELIEELKGLRKLLAKTSEKDLSAYLGKAKKLRDKLKQRF